MFKMSYFISFIIKSFIKIKFVIQMSKIKAILFVFFSFFELVVI